MKTLSAVLLFAVLAGAQSGYELKAKQAGVPLEKVQYAILHALLGWRGGSNPSFSYYQTKDKQVLDKAGISVHELTDKNERASLELALGKIRHDHNNGVKNVYNKSTFIDAAQMSARHKALIDKYADRVTASGTAPAAGSTAVSAYRTQNQRVTALVDPLNAMARAKTDAEFDAALKRFNEAAAGFGKDYKLSRGAGESYETVRGRGLDIYETERQIAISLGSKLGDPALSESLEALRNKAGLMFDAATQNAGGATGRGSFGSTADPNEAAARLGGAGLTADNKEQTPPKPEAKAGDKKPGLFGMLGSLFKGLFRTIARVVVAVVKGVIGVGKAIFS